MRVERLIVVDIGCQSWILPSLDRSRCRSVRWRSILTIQVIDNDQDVEWRKRAVVVDVELLDKSGAMSADEVAKFRLSFSKAKNSLAMHQLRSQLAEAKDIALKEAQSVEAETQIRRLTARKGQIEETIRDLFTAMKDLTRREEPLKSLDLKEQYLAKLLNLEVDSEAKTNEIEGLLRFLNLEKNNEEKKK